MEEYDRPIATTTDIPIPSVMFLYRWDFVLGSTRDVRDEYIQFEFHFGSGRIATGQPECRLVWSRGGFVTRHYVSRIDDRIVYGHYRGRHELDTVQIMAGSRRLLSLLAYVIPICKFMVDPHWW